MRAVAFCRQTCLLELASYWSARVLANSTDCIPHWCSWRRACGSRIERDLTKASMRASQNPISARVSRETMETKVYLGLLLTEFSSMIQFEVCQTLSSEKKKTAQEKLPSTSPMNSKSSMIFCRKSTRSR